MSRSANARFADIILAALNSGPLTTHELYLVAKKQAPDLCNDLDDWKHSLRGAQSSLQHARKIRRVVHRSYTWELLR
jgi:hypothetical protein